MSVVVERPIHSNVLLESFVIEQNPMILDTSWLGASGPGAPWGITLGGPGSTITWNEYSDNLLSVSIRRGGTRDGITVRNAAGLLTVALRDFEIDPFNPTFVVDAPIRFSAILGGAEHTLFTGRVRDLKTDWVTTSAGRTPITTIVGVDAVADLDATTRYGAMPEAGSETFRERIARLSSSAPVPIELPTDADYLDSLDQPYRLARTVFESSLSNHLTLACNSVGAMWWVDPLGHVRFQSRRWDAGAATLIASRNVEYEGGPAYPPETLQMIAPATDAGTNSQINAAIIRLKGAAVDPNDSSRWLATETDYPSQGWARPNRLPCLLETNNVLGQYSANAHNWLEPYRNGWTNMLSGIRWNAQQNMDRIADLEIGASILDARLGTFAGPWPRYVVIGVQHTITATRWMVDLTLIGADENS